MIFMQTFAFVLFSLAFTLIHSFRAPLNRRFWIYSAMQCFEILIWFCAMVLLGLWWIIFSVTLRHSLVPSPFYHPFRSLTNLICFFLSLFFFTLQRMRNREYVSHNGRVRHVSLRSTILFVAFWGLSYMSYYEWDVVFIFKCVIYKILFQLNWAFGFQFWQNSNANTHTPPLFASLPPFLPILFFLLSNAHRKILNEMRKLAGSTNKCTPHLDEMLKLNSMLHINKFCVHCTYTYTYNSEINASFHPIFHISVDLTFLVDMF